MESRALREVVSFALEALVYSGEAFALSRLQSRVSILRRRVMSLDYTCERGELFRLRSQWNNVRTRLLEEGEILAGLTLAQNAKLLRRLGGDVDDVYERVQQRFSILEELESDQACLEALICRQLLDTLVEVQGFVLADDTTLASVFRNCLAHVDSFTVASGAVGERTLHNVAELCSTGSVILNERGGREHIKLLKNLLRLFAAVVCMVCHARSDKSGAGFVLPRQSWYYWCSGGCDVEVALLFESEFAQLVKASGLSELLSVFEAWIRRFQVREEMLLKWHTVVSLPESVQLAANEAAIRTANDVIEQLGVRKNACNDLLERLQLSIERPNTALNLASDLAASRRLVEQLAQDESGQPDFNAYRCEVKCSYFLAAWTKEHKHAHIALEESLAAEGTVTDEDVAELLNFYAEILLALVVRDTVLVDHQRLVRSYLRNIAWVCLSGAPLARTLAEMLEEAEDASR